MGMAFQGKAKAEGAPTLMQVPSQEPLFIVEPLHSTALPACLDLQSHSGIVEEGKRCKGVVGGRGRKEGL